MKGGEELAHKKLEQIETFPNANTGFLKELFQDELDQYMEESNIVYLKEGVRFVTSRDKIKKVWVLLAGTVHVLEEYRTGMAYIFQENRSPSVFGEMEVLADIEFFMASLIAKTTCLCLTIPVPIYLQCLRKQPMLLYKRAQINLKMLLENGHDNRMYLQLRSLERLKLYFIKNYEVKNSEEICILRVTHQQIADETGYSIKTVLRGVNKLKEQGYLSVQGQKIRITQDQYKNMLHSIQDIVGHED